MLVGSARRSRRSCGLAILALGTVTLVHVPTATALVGKLWLASTTTSGELSNGSSSYMRVNRQALSTDGTKVVFDSNATNLDPADGDTTYDVYVKDLLTGAVQLVSLDETGIKGNADSRFPVVSGDGTKVAFNTRATNLDPRDTDEYEDLYVKDLVTGELTLASTDAEGVKSWIGAWSSSLSADGRKLSFVSAMGLSRDYYGGQWGVFVKDLATGHVQLASVSADGKVAEAGTDQQLSADGRRVVFSTPTTLLHSDGDNNYNPADNKVDVYVKDLATGELWLADTTLSGEKPALGAGDVSISGDGRRVAFSAHSTNLDPRHNSNVPMVYVKDLASGDLWLASVDDAGIIEGSGASLSADGNRVAFESAKEPIGVVSDGAPDVYVKDLRTGALRLGSSTASGSNTAGEMSLASISGNGARVAFTSGSSLLREDDNNTSDVYVKDLPGKEKKEKKGPPNATTTTTVSTTTTTTLPPGGTITTYAGTGVMGYSGDGGPATSASLAMDSGFIYCIRGECGAMDNVLRVTGLVAGPESSLYIADVRNHRVRKVDSSGVITTVAGTGVRGYGGDGGQAGSAALAEPRGLAVDGAGRLYIADTANHVVRRVDTTGVITTVAGNGTPGSQWHFYTDDGGPATNAHGRHLPEPDVRGGSA